ncbi:unnamed protein product [Rotaria sp. Silwood2]|nr:unnamed protein product [Rotaria sp. Silwood2]CAF2882984.1 unnamed protein product [Rotaria sp. Silwood2]CAF3333437.1 unnamed protein product [Rotaria sp. Silwood2]CAF4058932.1 unnamed protein product [Rotaria sp. Silwood2]CAF4151244.1 unnamed protein product [Rotaria sp. Silwood2]
MVLLFLFIKLFFLPISVSLNCIEGPNCHIKFGFNQTVPSHKKFLEICSTIEIPSCSVFLKIDYDNQQVDISFEKTSKHTQSPYPFIDLLTTNPQASIILRYTVEVKVHHNNKIQLYVLLQCQTHDQCTERQLRHFWPRFISLNNRRNSLSRFYNFLFLNASNFINCFDDQANQTVQCSVFDNNKCWASTHSERKCIKYNINHPNYFIYSYNKVDRPHQLTDEHVHYTLECHVNNCNNDENIRQLSVLARQFAENSRLMNNVTDQERSHDKSFTIKLAVRWLVEERLTNFDYYFDDSSPNAIDSQGFIPITKVQLHCGAKFDDLLEVLPATLRQE